MSAEVTIRIPPGRGGRRRGAAVGAPVAAGTADAPHSPPPERIPRVARVLALAHHWRRLIQSGVVRDQADLARLVGVSRARVTQVMNLLWLAPDIQEKVIDGAFDGPGTELELRNVAREVSWSEQRRRVLRESPAAVRPFATCRAPRLRSNERSRTLTELAETPTPAGLRGDDRPYP